MNYAKKHVKNERSLAAIDRLEKLHAILDSYGLRQYVNFDFGMISGYTYYTGIIFKAYTYGTGEPLVKGGRYNDLLRHFGKAAPSIGFAIVVDSLLTALSRQKLQIPVEDTVEVITYKPEGRKEAIRQAQQLRSQGKNIALRPEKED